MLTKIDHVGVAVRRVDEALRFYHELLGLPVTQDAVLADQGVHAIMLSAGETEIELLEPLEPNTPVGRFLERRGEGLHHLCFATDDVGAELRRASARGLRLVDEQPRPGLAGMVGFLHPSAANGVLVEYAQRLGSQSSKEAQASSGSPPHRFDHLAIAVSDLDPAVEVFVKNFDLTETSRRDSAELGIHSATLPLGQGWIGVVSPLTADSPVAKFIHKRGEGLYLVSLAVTNLDATRAILRAEGRRVTDPIAVPLAASAGGTRLAFIAPGSANGVLIQLLEQAA